MNAHTQIPTIKRFLNRAVRIPQRQNGTKLSSGAVVVINTFKNKQVIEVYHEPESRFLSAI
jgi:hypothetical protein